MISGKFNTVVDGQWGSCGKGLISSYLADRYRPQFLSTTNMANAGHTAVDRDGKSFVAKAIPSGAILNRWRPEYNPVVVIGASAAFHLERLLQEADLCLCGRDLGGIKPSWYWNADKHIPLLIHPRAGVITAEHQARESGDGPGSTKHIASTMQGCGTFLADKVLRTPGLQLARDYHQLAPFLPREHMAPWLESRLRAGDTILHEGSQGFSLDIHHGSHYPECYSPDTLVTVRKSADGAIEHNVRIRDLADGSYDQIKDFHGWTSLEAVWERPESEPLLAIVAGQHTLPVTAGHPVLIRRNGDNVEVRADQVRAGDWVYTPIPERPMPVKHLSDPMAYAIGYYLGDGWTVGKRREAAQPKSADKERARYARYRARRSTGLVGTPVATAPTKPKRTTQAYGVIYSSEDFHGLPEHLTTLGMEWYTKPTPSKASKLYVWNSHFARTLDDLGIKSELAPNKRLMPDFMAYNDATLAAILAGHIDSDGGVYGGGRIRFGITSLTLCAQWQRWLHSIGIKCLIRPEKKPSGGFTHNPDTNNWRLEIRFHANQEGHEVLEVLRRLSHKMAGYKVCKTNWFIGEQRPDRPRLSFWGKSSRVLMVKHINGKRAWDLTTGTSYFLANGVRGHNCTSRQTTAVQNLADMGLPARAMGEVYLVIRPFPIRVGNVVEDGRQTGYSGGCYTDQRELTWRDVADQAGMPESEAQALLTKELTTVTKRLRRVFSFSDQQLREAVTVNGATKIVLNFANYIDWAVAGTSKHSDLTPKVLDFIARVEGVAGIPVTLVGTGPRIDQVVDLE